MKPPIQWPQPVKLQKLGKHSQTLFPSYTTRENPLASTVSVSQSEFICYRVSRICCAIFSYRTSQKINEKVHTTSWKNILKAYGAKDENKLPPSYDDIARSSFAVFLQDTVCTYHCTDNHPTKPAIPNQFVHLAVSTLKGKNQSDQLNGISGKTNVK